MSTPRVLLQAFADLLAPIGVPVRNKDLGSDPNRGFALSLGGIGDDDRIATSTYTLQIRSRGLPNPSDDVDELAEQAKAILHGRCMVQLAGVAIGNIRRMSWVSLGQDANRRWERSDNYLLEGVTLPASELLPG